MKNLALKYKSIAVQSSVFRPLAKEELLILTIIKVDHSIFTILYMRNIRHSEKNA